MVTIAHFSDIHFKNPLDEDIVKRILFVRNSFSPDLYLISGDLAEHGTIEELQIAKYVLDQLDAPYVVVPGNHDKTDWSLSPSRFNDVFKPRRCRDNGISYDYIIDDERKVHVFGLNSTGWFRRREFARGRIPKKQLKELEKAAKSLHGIKIVVFHHQMFHIPQPVITKWFLKLMNGDKVMEAIFKSNIDIVMHGHRHVSANFFHYANNNFPRNLLVSCCADKDIHTSHVLKINNTRLELFEVVDKTINPIKSNDYFFGRNS